MAMEAVDEGHIVVGEVRREHAEARAGRTGIVERRLDMRMLGVDAQPYGNRLAQVRHIIRGHERAQAPQLREGVEGDVGRAAQKLREIGLGVGRREGVGAGAELLQSQTRLPGAGGRRGRDIFAQDGKRAPQGVGLEGQNDLGTGGIGHTADKLQIAAQKALLDEIVRRVHPSENQ